MTGDTWDLVVSSIGPLLSGAVRGMIPLSLLSFAFGLVLALLVALARLSSNRVLSGLARAYVSLIRGTPLLVQLFLIFYALPSVGVVIDPFPSAVVAFTLNVGGYAAETIRAAILSVPRGQWEAAASIGMNGSQTLRRVILPQAARTALPPMGNSFISLVKDTSLAATIQVPELFRQAQLITARTFEIFSLYLAAAMIYWVLATGLSWLQNRLEKRASRHNREAR